MNEPLIKLELNFHPSEIYFPSTKDFCLITDNKYPIYYNIKKYIYNNKEYKSITYKICYSYNGAIGFGYQLFPYYKDLGFHTIDREYIRILFDLETNKPKYVFFSAHRNEGKWLPWEQCKKNKKGDLVVYVANMSHANYPDYGTWFRILLFGNDQTSIRGKIINPSDYIYEDFNTNILNVEINNTFWKRFTYTG